MFQEKGFHNWHGGRPFLLIFGVLSIGLAFSPACGPRSTDPSSGKFRLAVLSWVGFGPAFVAEEKGLCDRHGIDLEVVRIEETGRLRAALTARSVDAIIGTVDSMATGLAYGLPARVVLKVDESNGSDAIVVDGSIREVADLRGRTVAFAQGIPSHFFLACVLRDAGLTVDDVEPVHMEAAEAGAAFLAGRVDAASTWEPWVTKALEREGARVLVTTREKPGFIIDLVAVHEDVLATRKPAVAAFLRGWFDAIAFIRDQPEEAREILSRSFGASPADIEAMLGGLRFAGLDENLRFFSRGESGPSPFEAIFDRAGNVWKSSKLVEEVFPGRNAFDRSPLEALERAPARGE